MLYPMDECMYRAVSRIDGWIICELMSVSLEWGNERRGCRLFVGGQLNDHVCVLSVINRGVGRVGFEPIPGQSRLGQWGQAEMASAHRLSRLEPRSAHFVSSGSVSAHPLHSRVHEHCCCCSTVYVN